MKTGIHDSSTHASLLYSLFAEGDPLSLYEQYRVDASVVFGVVGDLCVLGPHNFAAGRDHS